MNIHCTERRSRCTRIAWEGRLTFDTATCKIRCDFISLAELLGAIGLPKSLVRKAATYTRNLWAALIRYVEDGDLNFDNNFAERAKRPIAIGRNDYLFVGSELAGHRAAVLTSLIASCKNNLVEPWAYLRDIFDQFSHRPTP